MNASKLVGIALIVGGLLGLVYGGFSYTKETQQAKLGPLELMVKENKNVSIPKWAGVAAIVAGGLLLAFGSTKR
jgi:multidrug transporter EmrE-like cation transporter